MGESRGGEGRRRQPPTSDLAALLVGQVLKAGREIGLVGLQRLTDGQYMVLIQEHGANHSDEYVVASDGKPQLISGSSPFGGTSEDGT